PTPTPPTQAPTPPTSTPSPTPPNPPPNPTKASPQDQPPPPPPQPAPTRKPMPPRQAPRPSHRHPLHSPSPPAIQCHPSILKGTQTPALPLPPLHELKPEPPLHTKVPRSNRVVERRSHLDDRVVLHVPPEHAAHPAVRTHRLRHRLPPLIPRPRPAHVVLALEHQRPRRTHPDAVAAV